MGIAHGNIGAILEAWVNIARQFTIMSSFLSSPRNWERFAEKQPHSAIWAMPTWPLATPTRP